MTSINWPVKVQWTYRLCLLICRVHNRPWFTRAVFENVCYMGGKNIMKQYIHSSVKKMTDK